MIDLAHRPEELMQIEEWQLVIIATEYLRPLSLEETCLKTKLNGPTIKHYAGILREVHQVAIPQDQTQTPFMSQFLLSLRKHHPDAFLPHPPQSPSGPMVPPRIIRSVLAGTLAPTPEAQAVKARKVTLNDEEFMRVWNESASLDDAASKLGTKKSSTQVRASVLRKKGLTLQYFGGRRERRESI